jgi:EpsI family protein
MIGRAIVLAVLIIGGGAYGRWAQAPDRTVARAPLASVPCAIGTWQCVGDTPLERDVLAVLGVDDYVNRTYARSDDTLMGLYVGYYGSQRTGEAIHSPQNCLPGSGWQPVSSERTAIDAGGLMLPVNRYIVEKGLNRQVVLYWYQGRGRVIANEYANKFWLMVDQARLHRSNGSLVRLVAPVRGLNAAALAAASASADEFARQIYPRLTSYLP